MRPAVFLLILSLSTTLYAQGSPGGPGGGDPAQECYQLQQLIATEIIHISTQHGWMVESKDEAMTQVTAATNSQTTCTDPMLRQIGDNYMDQGNTAYGQAIQLQQGGDQLITFALQQEPVAHNFYTMSLFTAAKAEYQTIYNSYKSARAAYESADNYYAAAAGFYEMADDVYTQ